ncbi:MAG TPA: ribosome recycling factor [Anseongella sp.]
MSELVQQHLSEAKDAMQKAVSHTEAELAKIRAGKAMPSMLDGIQVDYYGSMMPLNQVSNVNTPDPRTIMVQPWEKSMLQPIEKAIMDANLGFNPQNDGAVIRISVPPLTEERRKDLVKKVRNEAEQGKISVRTIRKEANEKIKKLSGDHVSEDEIKDGEDAVQKLTDQHIASIEELFDAKEKDIMTV